MRFLDHETTDQESATLADHLKICRPCHTLLVEVGQTAGWTASIIEDWIQELLTQRSRIVRFRQGWGSVQGLVASLLVVGLTLTAIPTTRHALAALVQSFQFTRVATVTLTSQQINQIANQLSQSGTVSIQHYGSIKVEGVRSVPKTVPLSQVAGQSGLPYEWPQALTGSGVSAQITAPEQVVLTLNVNAINQLIKDEGGGQFFPQNVSGIPITVSVPTTVNIADGPSSDKTSSRQSTGQYDLTETGTPSISVPGSINERQIATAIASLPFLPQSLQEALVPLEHNLPNTVVIPTFGKPGHVTVQGQSGVLVTLPGMSSSMRTAIWVRDGVFNQFSYNGPMSSKKFVQEVQQWFP